MSEPELKTTVIDALNTIYDHVEEIAGDHGFSILDFGIRPSKDTASRLRIVVEYDPEKEKKQDIVIVQAQQAMDEAAEKAYKEKLEADAEEARRQLTEDVDLEKKLRGRGGFLDE